MSVNLQAAGLVAQLVVELLLLQAEGVVEEAGGDFQVSALLEQVRRRVQVTGRRAAVGQRACVFVYTQQQQRRLDGGERDVALAQVIDQQGAGGAHILVDDRPLRRQVVAHRVVVEHAHRSFAGHAAQGDQRLGVHQGHALNRFVRHITRIDEGQLHAVQGLECTHIAVQTPRQDRERAVIQQISSQ